MKEICSGTMLTREAGLFVSEKHTILRRRGSPGGHTSCSTADKKLLASINRLPALSHSGRRRFGEEDYHHREKKSVISFPDSSSGLDSGVQGRRGGACGRIGCVEQTNSIPIACGLLEKAVNSSSTRFCDFSGNRNRRRGSKKRGRMELCKPHPMMDTLPFQFLSDYHAVTQTRAVKDAISPMAFFGFGPGPKPVPAVVQAGDPVLHEPAVEVRREEIGSARIEKIINDMVATMRNAPGVGLAAPQIGVNLQIIVLEDTKELMSHSLPEDCEAQQRYPFDLLVIINPKLKTKSGSGSAVFFEGCLSVEGYRALVERDLEVEVSGLSRDGKPIHVEASGWKARILQHECDHVGGNLYVDKMVPKSFRTKENLRLPLPAGCPKPGVCKHSTTSLKV